MRPRLSTLLLVLSCFAMAAWPAGEGQAQVNADSRAKFPGRRVGGGTRGECTSRLIVHLVPESSVYAPGSSRLLGVLTGPTGQPQALELSFRPQQGTTAATAATGGRLLPADPNVALLLVRSPVLEGPTVWESSYRCGAVQASRAPTADHMDFAVGVAPPAQSLLLPDRDAASVDLEVQSRLNQLQRRCGASISRKELEVVYGLADLLAEWPDQVPVRCPS